MSGFVDASAVEKMKCFGLAPNHCSPSVPGLAGSSSVALGLFVGLGSISCDPPGRPWDISGPDGEAQVSLLNKTHEVQVLGVHTIDHDLLVDCDRVLTDAALVLTSAHFGSGRRAELFSGAELAIGPYQSTASGYYDRYSEGPTFRLPCEVFRVEAEIAPNIYVAWPGAGLSYKDIYEDAAFPYEIPANPQTVVLEADYSETPASQMNGWLDRPCGDASLGLYHCDPRSIARATTKPDGAVYTWRSEHDRPLHMQITAEEEPIPSICEISAGSGRLSWEDVPPSGREWRVVEFEEEQDGCFTLGVRGTVGDTMYWSACVPAGTLDPLDPAQAPEVRVEWRVEDNVNVIPGRRYQSVHLEVRHLAEEGALIRSGSISLVRGHGLPARLGLDMSASLRTGCVAQDEVEGCVNRMMPVDFTIRSGPREVSVASGQIVELSPNTGRRFHLITAYDRVIAERQCEHAPYILSTGATTGVYLEATAVTGFLPNN